MTPINTEIAITVATPATADQPSLHKQVRKQHADKAHNRADRKIDAARDDDKRRADAEDANKCRAMHEVFNVSHAQKPIAGERRVYANRDQQAKDAPDLRPLW